MNHSSDAQLLEKLTQGNLEAYDALFLKYYKMLCVNAYFYLKDTEEAKELVQQFFVELFEKRGYLRLEGDVKGYLYRAVKNRCLNWFRKAANDRKRSAQLLWETESTAHEEDREVVENLFNLLGEALNDLTVQRREALTLVYVQHKKYQEAANEMGISVNSLKTHLKLGLKNLRERLKNSRVA
ncbi:RNA polymerase sigma factor [Parapedobacter tibetensis]|uniref:RNA polymerase sigma factor n=1 Tax=Parapedobacter tibetensis TaxID=2972951 RepID=UPI00214D5A12|nr:sigma-70 family RNA polymerase sigma factor [Parapedobacter tibetensis]